MDIEKVRELVHIHSKRLRDEHDKERLQWMDLVRQVAENGAAAQERDRLLIENGALRQELAFIRGDI